MSDHRPRQLTKPSTQGAWTNARIRREIDSIDRRHIDHVGLVVVVEPVMRQMRDDMQRTIDEQAEIIRRYELLQAP